MANQFECEGELKGDPDIAGIGVVYSIWFTTFLAISSSWCLWFYVFWRQKHLDESKHFRRVLDCAFILADIQLVTALAIACSLLVLIYSDSDTSLYHVFVARCLAQTNLTGHGAAMIFDTQKQKNWVLRMVFLSATLILYTYSTFITIREFDHWQNVTPKCFYNDSWFGGEYTDWMKLDIPWTITAYLWLYADATGKLEHCLARVDAWTVNLLVDAWWNVRVEIPKKAAQLQFASAMRHAINPAPTSYLACFSTLRKVTFVLLIAAGVTFVRAIGPLSKSFGRLVFFLAITLVFMPPSTSPFCSTLVFAWNIYDVVIVRAANQHILVESPSHQPNISLQGNPNPENDWGFGQLLPLFLLLLVLLQLADSCTDERARTRHTSAHFIARAWLHPRFNLSQFPVPVTDATASDDGTESAPLAPVAVTV